MKIQDYIQEAISEAKKFCPDYSPAEFEDLIDEIKNQAEEYFGKTDSYEFAHQMFSRICLS